MLHPLKMKLTMKRFILFAAVALAASTAFAQDSEKLSLKVNGRGYIDATGVFQNDQEHISSGANISDLRIGISGKYQKWSAKIDLGYADQKVSFKDVYLQYNFKKKNYIRAGHYAEPFGIDYMESSGNIKFVDAGIVQQTFSPGRRLGLEYMAWGKGLWFAAGIFDDADAFNKRKNTDADDGYSITSRMAYAPIHEENKILHLGVAGSFRKPSGGTYCDKENGERIDRYRHRIGTPIVDTRYNDVTVTHADNNWRVAGELIAAAGPVALQGEYIYSSTTRDIDALKTYKAWGAYGQAAFMLLGDPYAYSESWARLALPKPGSLELAVRYAHVDLECPDASVTSEEWTSNKGVTVNKGHITNQLTVGLNYYYKPFLRFKLDYDNEHIRGMKSFNFVTLRTQFFF